MTDCLASPQMGEAVSEERPSRNFRQKIGHPDARQHGVQPARQGFRYWRGGFFER